MALLQQEKPLPLPQTHTPTRKSTTNDQLGAMKLAGYLDFSHDGSEIFWTEKCQFILVRGPERSRQMTEQSKTTFDLSVFNPKT